MKEVVHDGGPEFKKTFEAMCELLSVEDTVSVASRPMSHGIVEKFNHDVCQLIGKRVYQGGGKKLNLKPHQAKWTWALPFAVAAANSSPSKALSKGMVGYTPPGVFHGMEARLPLDKALKPQQGFVKESDAEVEEHMCAVREAQERACKWVVEAHAEYAQRKWTTT